ncbi:hypothetical protein HAV15_001322 [Penicillium sp. str. |nr:hypothetical protein HAV15_001322 [Penicillium sp. str. \
MYSSIQKARLSVARPCRFVARRRYSAPLSARRFHLSRTWLASPSQDPHDAESTAPGNVVEDPSLKAENISDNGTPATPPSPELAKSITKTYGSAVRRAMRNRKSSQQTSPSTATVPAWFYEHNKVSHSSEDRPTQSLEQVQITKSRSKEPKEVKTESQASGGDSDPSASGEPPTVPENRYAVAEESWEELRASAKAGLRLPAAKYAKEPSVKKAHLALHYPGSDGIPFLDAVVKKLAHELGTDLVTLNAQDIAQLFSEQDLADAGVTSPIRSLGYDVYRQSVPSSWSELEDPEGDGEDDVTEIAGGPRGMRGDISTPRFITIESSKEAGDIPLPNWLGLKTLLGGIDQWPNGSGSWGRGLTKWSARRNSVDSTCQRASRFTRSTSTASPH